MFTHLLVPLDGSRLAETALPAAATLAKQFNGRITLLRVVRPPDITTSTSGSAMAEVLAMLRTHSQEEAQAYLHDLQSKLRREGHRVHGEVVFGDNVAQIILDEADNQGADAIVMSTHGRGGLSRWVFGSVADKVLRQARIPILLIRSEEG
jgi:nucleotide-binding universal stress UspA family protein